VRGKPDRTRDVPIVPPLLRRLERLAGRRTPDQTTDRLFVSHRRGPTGEYEPLTESGIYKVVTEAAVSAGLGKHVHPHLMRHSWMTEMLRQRMHPVQLALIAGTSLPVIMKHYEHLTKTDGYEAMLSIYSALRR
jgi:integrase